MSGVRASDNLTAFSLQKQEFFFREFLGSEVRQSPINLKACYLPENIHVSVQGTSAGRLSFMETISSTGIVNWGSPAVVGNWRCS